MTLEERFDLVKQKQTNAGKLILDDMDQLKEHRQMFRDSVDEHCGLIKEQLDSYLQEILCGSKMSNTKI